MYAQGYNEFEQKYGNYIHNATKLIKIKCGGCMVF